MGRTVGLSVSLQSIKHDCVSVGRTVGLSVSLQSIKHDCVLQSLRIERISSVHL
jgi:hypothetical protein